MRDNNVPASRRSICLFAHYDGRGRVQPYVLHYLRALREAGYLVHLARSDERALDAADRTSLEDAGAVVHLRANRGLDFGAWQELIRAEAARGADEILLANDSVFGPFSPLAPIRREMTGFDAWGMVSSREGRRHLQSWFVSMTGDAFRRPAVQRVFAMPFADMTKEEIVLHGELGLSAAFEAEELDVGARYVDMFRLRPSGLIPVNPAHFRWRSLIRSGAVPFLKLELIRDNPSRVIGTGGWRQFVGSTGSWPAPADLLGTALASRPAPKRPLPALGWRGSVLHLGLHGERVEALRDGWRRPRAPGEEADRSYTRP